QNGRGGKDWRSRINGEWSSGPDTLTDEELRANRTNYGQDLFDHPLVDDYWKERIPDLSKVNVPLLSAGNWGGVGLHPRGNFEGYLGAASTEKWLEVHGLDHFTHFYTDYGVALQKRFLGHFLKGEDTGWSEQPKVSLHVREPGEKFTIRGENEWPLARTEWTKYYLHSGSYSLKTNAQSNARGRTYDALGKGLTYLSEPVAEDTEITGPIAAKLFISSETEDADIFLALRVFDEEMREVTFQGSNDPHTPIGLGWLRASHRKLDKERSLPYRPYHTHDEVQPLTPGEIYELDVEIWPTCIVLPAGYRFAINIRGRDYVYSGFEHPEMPYGGRVYSGVGPFRHNHKEDRPVEVFGKKVTFHTGPDWPSYVMLPIIPAK
ncbi:MAG: peptidase S15, partial [Nitrospinaceae bacterium]|nr:peptidase S15 [Nitrospinaceae bacterium]